MTRSPFAWILPTALAALLLALHLFTPVSPLAIAHSSERPTASAPAASAAVVHGVSATVAEAETPTEAADSGSRALVRPRATRLVWSTPSMTGCGTATRWRNRRRCCGPVTGTGARKPHRSCRRTWTGSGRCPPSGRRRRSAPRTGPLSGSDPPHVRRSSRSSAAERSADGSGHG